MQPLVSVVLPCYNEIQNLEPLIGRLREVLEPLTKGLWEVIFVDDASDDGTAEALDKLSAADSRIKAIHFARNFGHQAAQVAGLEHAKGRAVVLMDADLQDPPEVIASLFERWQEGYHVAYAVRRRRKESVLKRAAYSFFYRSLRLLAEVKIPLDSGDFCMMDERVVRVLTGMRERHRFLRGLRSWVGFRQIGVEYERSARFAGEPKYTLGKLIQLALSGYIGFSTKPLRIAMWLGFGATAFGFAVLVWAIYARLAGAPVPWGWASTMAAILFLGGTQLAVAGIIGEYVGRVYDEVRGRPLYVVRDLVGFEAERTDAT